VQRTRFFPGELVHHKLFDYRGVVIDVDPEFQGSEEWYRRMARSRPPKDQPWYHVLVHNATHNTYVAERNLERDDSGAPIDHPYVDLVFESFGNGVYSKRSKSN
jgi:heat shock protein HspQ